MALDVDTRKILAGFVGTAVLLAILLYVAGTGDVLAALAILDVRSLLVVASAGVLWLAAWGGCLRTVLASLDVDVPPLRSVLLYASAAFANNVTPFGQAGGEPFSALLISRATDSEYERSLAAIASVDSINFVPSIALALLGLGYYAAKFTVGDRVRLVAGIVVVLAVGIPALAYVLWRARRRVKHGLAGVITPFVQRVAGVIPGVTPPSTRTIRYRVAGFFDAIARVADDRHSLLGALAFSATGWIFMCLSLWLSLDALGHHVPLPIVFVVVPVATIASVTPLPGGAGGVEFALVLLLVPTTAISTATATSAAIVYRGATYWLSTGLGGLSVLVLQRYAHR